MEAESAVPPNVGDIIMIHYNQPRVWGRHDTPETRYAKVDRVTAKTIFCTDVNHLRRYQRPIKGWWYLYQTAEEAKVAKDAKARTRNGK